MRDAAFQTTELMNNANRRQDGPPLPGPLLPRWEERENDALLLSVLALDSVAAGCRSRCWSFIHCVNRACHHELHVPSLREPRECLGVLLQQLEVFRGVELHADSLRARNFLDLRINPLLAVLEEGFAGDKAASNGLMRFAIPRCLRLRFVGISRAAT